ncbi:hypothetical protein HMPREF3156_02187 [Neisseria sp. HMSC06F02]|nr:hypothetical protein HMPREF3156_02187 [Neisseria sp. HMSC06F02]
MVGSTLFLLFSLSPLRFESCRNKKITYDYKIGKYSEFRRIKRFILYKYLK